MAGVRGNQLVGYGLVVGLDGTGDQTSQAPFTDPEHQEHAGAVRRHGAGQRQSAAEERRGGGGHADLPPFSKAGQTIDVTVSSIGNAG